MSTERWRQVCAVFAAALRYPTADRDILLREACAGDAAASRDGFLDVPTLSVTPPRPMA